MKNKINVAEILKNCPIGMELDCVLSEDVILDGIDMSSNYPIRIIIGGKQIEYLSPEGCLSSISFTNYKKAKCVIFPKGKTTWEGFIPPYKFKDGDVIFKNNFIAIVSHIKSNGVIWYHCWYHIKSKKCKFKKDFGIGSINDIDEIRLATEEEKEKLFDAIKENGYKWNAEIKTLGKLDDTEFKDGDVVFYNDTIAIFKEWCDETLFRTHVTKYLCCDSLIDINVPLFGKSIRKEIRLATEEEKEKLFKIIEDNGYKWNAETKTLEKLTVPSTTEKFYIRIGDIPSEEKSSVYRGDAVVGYEEGVSVYDCVETDGLYRIVMPFPLKEGQGMTYECLIQEITQCRYEIEKPRNVYLVSGIEVGKGHDNEPLIKDVKILKDLTEQFNTKNDNTEEIKTLEKLIEPKFKVGDKVQLKEDIREKKIIDNVFTNCYTVQGYGVIFFTDQDKWELAPNKFDITTLKIFDKVLVRDYDDKIWIHTFWGKLLEDDSNCRYLTSNGCYKYCIPYEGNEQLLGTTNDCDEYYKTWK